MDRHATACAALERVLSNAPALRLVVGLSEHANLLEFQADDTLKRARAVSEGTPQVMDCVCHLMRTCLRMANSVDESLEASTTANPESHALIVWGFSVEVAETICFGLAAVANIIKADAESAALFEDVGKGLDQISVHLFGGLCRLDSVNKARSPDARLMNAFQCICVWTLAILQRFTGSITSEVLWEWVSQDPLKAFVLAKGVLLFRADCAPEVDVGLMSPPNLLELKDSVTRAAAGLSSPAIAFFDEVECEIFADDLDGGFPMAHRNVGLAQHRAKLAVAAVDSDFLDTVVREALLLGGPSWLPSAVSLLATLTMPPPADAAAWKQVTSLLAEDDHYFSHEEIFTFTDAQGVADALVAQTSASSDAVWSLLSRILWVPLGIPRGFYTDCATLSYVLPPNSGACEQLFEMYFEGHAISCLEPAQVMALCALASNCGVAPSSGKPITSALQLLSPEMKMAVVERMFRSRIAIRNSEIWRSWYDMFGTEVWSPEPAASEQPPPERTPQPAASPEKQASRPGIRNLMKGAPKELCCALDGKLVVDPVRSPHGHIFERSNIARQLSGRPGLCPFTGLPLVLEDCPRAPDVRLQATQWVREVQPMARVF